MLYTPVPLILSNGSEMRTNKMQVLILNLTISKFKEEINLFQDIYIKRSFLIQILEAVVDKKCKCEKILQKLARVEFFAKSHESR